MLLCVWFYLYVFVVGGEISVLTFGKSETNKSNSEQNTQDEHTQKHPQKNKQRQTTTQSFVCVRFDRVWFNC